MGEPLLLDWDPIDRPLLDGSYGSLEKISDDDSNGYSKLDPSFLPSSYSSNDGFHADSRTNSTQDHVWSPFIMVCVVTAITISSFNILPLLNINLQSLFSCYFNCTLKKIIYIYIYIYIYIVTPYKSLWLFLKVFQKIQYLVLMFKRARF